MTARAVWALRTRASRGAVRWADAAVIALLAALAVLIHHETAVAATSSTPSSATHVMPPGMAMADSRSAPEPMPGHAHESGPEQTAEPIVTAPPMSGAHGQACSGMAMQHCATASFEVVKLVPPTQSRESSGLASYGAVTAAPKIAGAADRAPPDLSVLSQLRI
jgi:hypothetical protein